MEMHITKHEQELRVAIFGDIDHHTSGEIREKVDKEYVRRKCMDIVFDFERVSFMDSSGIGMIIGRFKKAQKNNGEVYIVNMGSEIKRIFEISGLQKIIGVR